MAVTVPVTGVITGQSEGLPNTRLHKTQQQRNRKKAWQRQKNHHVNRNFRNGTDYILANLDMPQHYTPASVSWVKRRKNTETKENTGEKILGQPEFQQPDLWD